MERKEARRNKDLNTPDFNLECDPMETEEIAEAVIEEEVNLEVGEEKQQKLKRRVFDKELMNQKRQSGLFEDLMKEQQFVVKNPLKKRSRMLNKDEEEPMVQPKIKKEKQSKAKGDDSDWSDDDKFKVEKPQSAMEKRRK